MIIVILFPRLCRFFRPFFPRVYACEGAVCAEKACKDMANFCNLQIFSEKKVFFHAKKCFLLYKSGKKCGKVRGSIVSL